MRMVAHVNPARTFMPDAQPPDGWQDQITSVHHVQRQGRATVRRIELVDGSVWLHKTHATAGRARQEGAAMTHARAHGMWGVAPATPTCDGLITPWMAGATATPDQTQAAADAGDWLKQLHAFGAQAEPDPLPVKEAYRRRWSRLQAALRTPHGGQEATEVALKANAAWQAAFLQAEPQRERTITHGDFGPHNWIVLHGRLHAVVDFEFARDDLPERDLARYWLHAGQSNSEAWTSFRAAYGDVQASGAWLQLALLLEAGGTLEVGLKTGDSRLRNLGLRALSRPSSEAFHGA